MVQVQVGTTKKPSTPHAVPILVSTKNKYAYAFEEAGLEKILCNPEFKGHYVSVISIAGAFRHGKSFLLNFFLRYLNAKYVKKDITEWMGKEDQPLTGFTWDRGCTKITDGILIWSEIFTTEINGDKVAIILMDTQGVWDDSCTTKQCVTIFSLATLLSSVLIYNIMRNIQKDDLQHLQMFAEFGRLIAEETNGKPFQKLQILVRDWPWPDQHPYGQDGGDGRLEEWLKNKGIPDDEDSEMQGIRDSIESCFDEYSCYLMPEPGREVTRNPEFTGRLRNIATEFREELLSFVPMILAPENLIIKTINGEKVTMPLLFEYFKNYIKMYASDDLPEPKSMFMATAEVSNKTAMEKGIEKYTEMMDESCGDLKTLHSREQLIEIQDNVKKIALATFDSFKKLGGEKYSQPFRNDLEDLIEKKFETYNKSNDKKLEEARRQKIIKGVATVGVVAMGGAVIGAVAVVAGPAFTAAAAVFGAAGGGPLAMAGAAAAAAVAVDGAVVAVGAMGGAAVAGAGAAIAIAKRAAAATKRATAAATVIVGRAAAAVSREAGQTAVAAAAAVFGAAGGGASAMAGAAAAAAVAVDGAVVAVGALGGATAAAVAATAALGKRAAAATKRATVAATGVVGRAAAAVSREAGEVAVAAAAASATVSRQAVAAVVVVGEAAVAAPIILVRTLGGLWYKVKQ